MISSSERAADGCVRYSADVPVHVTIFLATLLLCCVSRGQTRVGFGATAKLADNGQLLRVPRSFAKAEKRAVDIHRRLDPIAEKTAGVQAKEELLENLFVKAVKK